MTIKSSMLGEYGRSVMRMQVRQSTSSLFRARMSTFATNGSQLDSYAKGASVSAPMFAEVMHKCGVPKKRLHQDLYPLEFGQSAWPGTFPIAVAVSGGADSMALMLLLREYLQEHHIKTPLLAVTVDHQLRPESSREALEVANVCADRGGIRHITKVCEWQCEEKTKQQPGEGPTASLRRPVKPRASKMEEHARQYRYHLLRQVCLEYHVRCLFVAHNRGDQLETTLFRLGRASGTNGLAGIASQLPLFSVDRLLCHPLGCKASTSSTMTTIVRPLLSVTKDQLMATCDRLQQTWVHDPSNDDPTYDRVRIRQALKRIEKEEQGAAVLDLIARFQQTAKKAKHEFAALERLMLQKHAVTWEADMVVMQTSIVHDPDVFDELLYRLLSIVIVHIGKKDAPPRLASIARLARDLRDLKTGKQLTLGGCRIMWSRKRRELIFQPEGQKKK